MRGKKKEEIEVMRKKREILGNLSNIQRSKKYCKTLSNIARQNYIFSSKIRQFYSPRRFLLLTCRTRPSRGQETCLESPCSPHAAHPGPRDIPRNHPSKTSRNDVIGWSLKFDL